jgi:hypothetical protein
MRYSGFKVSGGEALTSDLDIYRTAKLLIDQHGEDAPTHYSSSPAF